MNELITLQGKDQRTDGCVCDINHSYTAHVFLSEKNTLVNLIISYQNSENTIIISVTIHHGVLSGKKCSTEVVYAYTC